MGKNGDFYIGWQEEMSDAQRRFLKKRLLPLFIGIPILVFLFVFFQKPFNQHLFEFGNISEITGVYYSQPFPMLIAEEGALSDELAKDILLVGFGKFGARGIMDALSIEHGKLEGKQLTLAGTLIHGDGKTLLELTDETNSLVKVGEKVNTVNSVSPNTIPITLEGEILDPKCYFGVMKPGEGKIHKSCAIRCISGGIPPVFRQATGDKNRPYDYFLVVNEEGNSMNQTVLPFVGEPITASGNTADFMGWKILYTDQSKLKALE